MSVYGENPLIIQHRNFREENQFSFCKYGFYIIVFYDRDRSGYPTGVFAVKRIDIIAHSFLKSLRLLRT